MAEMIEVVVVQCLVIVRLRPWPVPGVPYPKPTASRYNRGMNWAKQQWQERSAKKKAKQEEWQSWGQSSRSSSGSGSWSNRG